MRQSSGIRLRGTRARKTAPAGGLDMEVLPHTCNGSSARKPAIDNRFRLDRDRDRFGDRLGTGSARGAKRRVRAAPAERARNEARGRPLRFAAGKRRAVEEIALALVFGHGQRAAAARDRRGRGHGYGEVPGRAKSSRVLPSLLHRNRAPCGGHGATGRSGRKPGHEGRLPLEALRAGELACEHEAGGGARQSGRRAKSGSAR